MRAMASQITSLTIFYSSVYSGADKKNIKASLANHQWIPRKGPVIFPFDNVIMELNCNKDAVRGSTNCKEQERVSWNQHESRTPHRWNSPWRHDSFEHFKTFVVPPRTLAISAMSNDFFSEPERTATNYTVLDEFCHESGFVVVRRKIVRVWPRI